MATQLCQKCKQSHPGRVCDYDEKGECAETIGVNEVAQPCNEPSKDEKDGFAGETDDGKVNECGAEPPSSEAKTMKMKTWTVITNTGKHADLESGIEKKEVQKPPHISARDFIHWLAAASRIDDDSLRSLFKL